MMLNSPLPDAEWGDKRLPEDDGSDKLPEEGGDKKLPEERGDKKLPEEGGDEKLPEVGGGEKLPEKTHTGKLIVPYIDKVLPFSLSLVL